MEMSPTDDLEPVTGSSGDVETGAEGTSAAESGESVATAPSPSKQTKRDPLVQVLWMLILGIVVLTLVTVVYALVTGVFGTGAPRTMQQYKIENARARIEAGSKERQDWMDYIIALTDNKQYALAQQWIDKGKRTLKNQDTSADMVYMQANLDLAQGKLDSALKNADLGLKTIKTGHDKAVAEWKKTGNPTEASVALSQNYWELLLIKADIYEQRKQWKNALAVYDEYLAGQSMAASVMVQRGHVKEELGDKKGAEADFRQALKFIPDDADALAGLKRIGAQQ